MKYFCAHFIKSRSTGEVSMRLAADRYDSNKWPNMRPDQDSDFTHHVIEGK